MSYKVIANKVPVYSGTSAREALDAFLDHRANGEYVTLLQDGKPAFAYTMPGVGH